MSWNERREPSVRQVDDSRDAAEIDYARVVHSASFRRLQGKTQILNLGDSDFYRTRLTHSLEVAQIASGITKQLGFSFPQHPASSLLPDRALIQAIGLTHDFGHPPFGHGGEVALNYCMPSDKGFEGNGQTLRILARLEDFSKEAGANLTRRAMLGILKYPVAFSHARNPALVPKLAEKPTTLRIIDTDASKPPKCYHDSEQDIVDWILKPLSDRELREFQTWDSVKGKHNKPRHKSLDCSIMDAADDIAYGVHDLEDAIALHLISKDSFAAAVRGPSWHFLEYLEERYPAEADGKPFDRLQNALFGESGLRKRYIGRLVHYFISAVEYDERTQFEEPLLRYRARVRQPERAFLDVLQKLVVDEVIKSPNVQHLEFKGQGMVVAVFEALQSDPERLLPADALKRYKHSSGDLRTICDHVAGMTDSYLLKTYERLFAPRMGSVFDKL